MEIIISSEYGEIIYRADTYLNFLELVSDKYARIYDYEMSTKLLEDTEFPWISLEIAVENTECVVGRINDHTIIKMTYSEKEDYCILVTLDAKDNSFFYKKLSSKL